MIRSLRLFLLFTSLCGLVSCTADGPTGTTDDETAEPDAHAKRDAGSSKGEPASDGDDEEADDGLGAATEPASENKALLPFKTGNRWTYEVTGDGETLMKVTTVGAEEPVGLGPHASKLAFKVVTTKGESDKTVSWQAVEGDRVVRYREQAFKESTGELKAEEWWSPAKLHVDGSAAHTAQGAKWTEQYQETKMSVGADPSTAIASDPWTLDGVNQKVTVPAGTFRAIVLTKDGGSSMKTYWYVPGIGKVKETGGQTEVLVSYELAP